MTHMTPTGRATGGELITKYGARLIQAYLPYDRPDACARCLDHFKPCLGLLMETELWPNLIAAAKPVSYTHLDVYKRQAQSIGGVVVECDDFSERRKAALQFPADLPAHAEQQDLHSLRPL